MGFTTRRAALGAADLERPAGGDRRPLAGIFRVRIALDSHRDVVQDGICNCSGSLGVSFKLSRSGSDLGGSWGAFGLLCICLRLVGSSDKL